MNEKLHIRWVFIMFISQKDDTGFISGTRRTMARNFNISIEEFDDAIKVLSSPDPESRTKEFNGKRIDVVEGGWILLNHEKYRTHEQKKTEKRREYMKEYMRNKRKNDDSVNNVNVNKVNSELTPVNDGFTSVSISESLSSSLSESSKISSNNLDTSNTGKSKKKKTKSASDKIKVINLSYRKNSELLKKRILELRQQKITEETLDKWDNSVRLMIERDGRSVEDIEIMINECHDMPPNPQTGFTWRDNIRSMDKLRHQWNDGKIYIGMNNKNKIKQVNNRQYGPRDFTDEEIQEMLNRKEPEL